MSVFRRVGTGLCLESPWLTFGFWVAVGMVALAFVLSPYPPMIDYPQHVAMGALLHDIWARIPYAIELYETNPFTYNAGIETSIALLSFVVNPELAGRLILAAHVVIFALAALGLCDYGKRPRWYALLAVPLMYNHITGWGFANFVVALPLMLLVSLSWLRMLDGERQAWRMAFVVLVSMVVAYFHVLVMLCLCVVVSIASLEVLFRSEGGGVGERVRRLVVPALVLVPSVGYSLGAWFWARATSTTIWEHSWAEGQDDPLWTKLFHLLYNATGNFADGSDQGLLGAVLVLGAALWAGTREKQSGPSGRMKRLFWVFFALYLLIPKVFIATFHIYQRFLPISLLFGIAAIPVVKAPWTRFVAPIALFISLVAGANVLSRFTMLSEVHDALAIIDDAPAEKTMAGVLFDTRTTSLNREIWVHLPAHYQIRKQGILAYSFLRNESVPVHYRPGKEPSRPPGGFEWDGTLYDFRASYARDFDLVLVRTWAGETIEDPAFAVFHGEQGVKLLSQRGRFFLYEASEANRRMRADKTTIVFGSVLK